MTEIERIQDQLKRSFFGPAWHGPCVTEALENVSAKLSAEVSIKGVHSIRELVDHIVYWKNVVGRVLKNEKIDVMAEFERDWPKISDHSAEAWELAKARLHSEHEDFSSIAQGITESDLDREVMGVKNRYTVNQVIHGVIQHDLYHAGQIMLLKKENQI